MAHREKPLYTFGSTNRLQFWFIVFRDCARWSAVLGVCARPVSRQRRGRTPSGTWRDRVQVRSSVDNGDSADTRWAAEGRRWLGRQRTTRPSRRQEDVSRTRTERVFGCGSCQLGGREGRGDGHEVSWARWDNVDDSLRQAVTTPPAISNTNARKQSNGDTLAYLNYLTYCHSDDEIVFTLRKSIRTCLNLCLSQARRDRPRAHTARHNNLLWCFLTTAIIAMPCRLPTRTLAVWA